MNSFQASSELWTLENIASKIRSVEVIMNKFRSLQIFLDPIENRSAERFVQLEVVQFEALLYPCNQTIDGTTKTHSVCTTQKSFQFSSFKNPDIPCSWNKFEIHYKKPTSLLGKMIWFSLTKNYKTSWQILHVLVGTKKFHLYLTPWHACRFLMFEILISIKV